jgi:MFS family permease
MASGPLVGGWIFDRYGGYSWLFLASSVLGIAAFAMAFTFPRAPQPQLQPA